MTGSLPAAPPGAIPGGCDQCDAYQTIHPDPEFPRITHLTIHHDDWCPVLARHQGRAS